MRGDEHGVYLLCNIDSNLWRLFIMPWVRDKTGWRKTWSIQYPLYWGQWHLAPCAALWLNWENLIWLVTSLLQGEVSPSSLSVFLPLNSTSLVSLSVCWALPPKLWKDDKIRPQPSGKSCPCLPLGSMESRRSAGFPYMCPDFDILLVTPSPERNLCVCLR